MQTRKLSSIAAKLRRPHEQQPRAASPWGIPAPMQSPTGGNAVLTPLDANDGFPTPSAQPSPHSVVRMMASTDPLIPARAVANAGNGVPNAGLGFETEAPVQAEAVKATRAIDNDQRASLPAPRPRSVEPAATTTPATATTTTPTSTKAKRAQRNYRNHKGENRFLLGGLLMTSSDNPLPLSPPTPSSSSSEASFTASKPNGLRKTSAPPLSHSSPTSGSKPSSIWPSPPSRDPGILPRALDPDPPCVLGDSPYSPGHHALADPKIRWRSLSSVSYVFGGKRSKSNGANVRHLSTSTKQPL